MSSLKAKVIVLFFRLTLLCGLLCAIKAWAGGPRFVSGTSGYNKAGIAMGWYTDQPLYFTDPGDLNASVTHAQADAMVAAAAAVWNVPTANITLAQGGSLAEHVSSGNTYFDGSNVIFPADVLPSNYPQIQIAIIYDSDGSVIDLLLGSGASDPSGCLQSGVIESVDEFGKTAVIEHAVIVLNGRCVGSDPRQMLQMQYQLTRTFGRVLGLGWSQLNDAIFTGAAPVTAAQEAFWPLMHPIDVRCSTYTYQCMQKPFTLRPDDTSALAQLYPVTTTTATKTQSTLNAVSVSGPLTFPSGQGMELVNVVVTRMLANVDHNKWEAYPIVSSTSGFGFVQNAGNTITGVEAPADNAGSTQAAMEGGWALGRVPSGNLSVALRFQTEPINPLYYGEYAVGAYQRPVITMSGSPLKVDHYSITSGATFKQTLAQADAAPACTPTSGTAAKPSPTDPSGWWSDVLCSVGKASWYMQAVKANRSWTIEATALDETGAATPQKAQIVLGVWNANDPVSTLPTVAEQPVAMNSMSLGMTQVQISATSADATLRIAMADQFGAGRPDFAFKARVLYADSVSPLTLGSGGGQITLTGTGFRLGNQVLVNGVAAVVTSWTATQIVATAPSKSIAGASTKPVDVMVLDASTAGSTTIQSALTYTGTSINTMALVSAPTALKTGAVAATPFAARVTLADGVTPASGASVSFVVNSSGGGGAVLMNCGNGVGCTALTDANGLVQQSVMGVAAGGVTVVATEITGGASVQATMMDADPVRSVTIHALSQYLAAGAGGQWSVSLNAIQDGAPAPAVPVSWSTAAVGFTVTPATATTASDGSSTARVQVNAIAGASTNVIGGCVWDSLCATWKVYGVDASQWLVSVAQGDGQSVRAAASLLPVTLLITDTASHPLPGAPVNIYQTAYAWEGPCPAQGPCPAAPVLATAQSSAVSDASGLVQVTPLSYAGPQVLKIATSSGTQGFATATLVVTP